MQLTSKRKAAAAIVILIVVVVAFFSVRPGYYLTLRNSTTGQVYARYPIESTSKFSVGFIHSVNKSPFIDLYDVNEDKIAVTQCAYYAFGAGVETTLNPDYTLDYLPDGAMLLDNMNLPMGKQGVTYSVSCRSDHTLILGDLLSDYDNALPYVGVIPEDDTPITTEGGLTIISLTRLAGEHKPVQITSSYRLWG